MLHAIITGITWYVFVIGAIISFMMAASYHNARYDGKKGTEGRLDWIGGVMLITILVGIVAILLTWGKI